MSFGKFSVIGKSAFSIAVMAFCIWPGAAIRASAQGFTGAVYAMTNQTSGNAIVAFDRNAQGDLRLVGTFATGGAGFGSGNDPLGSAGSLLLSCDGHFLLAVNAGSNNVSVMRARRRRLELVGTFASGGTEPVSLALYKDLVYVLNAGGTPNITGFELNPDGTLAMLADSSRPLAGGAGAAPAQVGFTADGSFLVVTEKGTSLIDTYAVSKDGLAEGPISNPADGSTPFGFAPGRSGTLIVSEAGGGTGGTSAASSYVVSRATNGLETVSASVGDTQLAACWVVTTNDGRFTYLANSASGTLSSYRIAPGGKLRLLNPTSADTGSGSVPIDMAMSVNSKFLYVLDDGTGSISAFRIRADGSLTALAGAAGLPAGSQGIAAR